MSCQPHSHLRRTELCHKQKHIWKLITFRTWKYVLHYSVHICMRLSKTGKGHQYLQENIYTKFLFLFFFNSEARNGPSISLSADTSILCPVVYQQYCNSFLNDFYFILARFMLHYIFCMCVDLLANFTPKSPSFWVKIRLR